MKIGNRCSAGNDLFFTVRSLTRSPLQIVLLGLLICFSDSVHAQVPAVEDPTELTRKVTLSEMYQEALANNEQVGIAKENLIRSERDVDRALSQILPRLDVDAAYRRRDEAKLGATTTFILRPKQEETFNVVLSQPLFTGGRAIAGYRIAKQGIQGSQQGLSDVKEQLLFDVAQGYYRVLKARKNVAIEESEVKRLEAHRRDSDKRVQVGEVTKTVLLRSEAELSGAKASLIREQNAFETAKDRLSFLTKMPRELILEEPPLLDLPLEGEEELVRQALKNRPDLAQQRINEKIALQEVKVAKGTFYPSFTLEGHYSWIDQDPAGSFLVKRDASALVRMDFPIFEGGLRKAEVSQAHSKVRETELSLHFLREEIAIEVRKDLLDLASVTSALQNLKDQLLFARDNFNLVSRQFAVGLATNIDVLDANATLKDAERFYANTVYDRELAILRIYRDIGVFEEKMKEAHLP